MIFGDVPLYLRSQTAPSNMIVCNCVGGPNCCIRRAEREREAFIRREAVEAYKAAHPDGHCTETCGCLTHAEVLAKYREPIP